MSDNDYIPPEPEASRAFFAEMGARAGKAAERSEHDPWQHEYRRVAAKVERAGDESLFADFQRRFLMSLALAYPPWTHTRW
jgi:hypothetical protein